MRVCVRSPVGQMYKIYSFLCKYSIQIYLYTILFKKFTDFKLVLRKSIFNQFIKLVLSLDFYNFQLISIDVNKSS
jgi:transposase